MGSASLALHGPAVALASEDMAARAQSFELIESGDRTTLSVWIDGNAVVSSFDLESPQRLVVVIENALLVAKGSRLGGKGGTVQRVRYSQFAAKPKPVTRLVVDLLEKTPYEIESFERGITVSLGVRRPRSTRPRRRPSRRPARPRTPSPRRGRIQASRRRTAVKAARP